MRITRSIVASAMIAVAVAFTAGCDDDETTMTQGTPADATAEPAANVTPFPTPLISGNRLESPTKGYAANFPAGWNVRPNLVQTFDASVDAIFEPLRTGASFQPNIAITCLVVRPDTDEERQASFKTNIARQGLNKDIQVSERSMAGTTATVLSYINESQSTASSALRLDKQDVLFRGPICDYTITTTTLEGQRAVHQPAFDAFLDSFELIP